MKLNLLSLSLAASVAFGLAAAKVRAQ